MRLHNPPRPPGNEPENDVPLVGHTSDDVLPAPFGNAVGEGHGRLRPGNRFIAPMAGPVVDDAAA
ncbi:hypothetical protein OG215_37265 (plasmid) [Streptomyces globisporus]|uniref:hypothetical protein n=1 Tax=Streptomyces globisporus TaxID=1908 RepID=UPI00386F35F3|nr:hypothetical protein OG215_37265 [Streptomyces globisporus]